LADEIRELFPALVEVECVEEVLPEAPHAVAAPVAASPLRQVGDYRFLREVGRAGWASSMRPSRSRSAGGWP
jgi:hypothetical protein